MRNLISGIVGIVLGSLCLLSSLVQGGPQGQGGYFAGQVCALVMGALFFFGGLAYLVMGIISLQAGSQKKKKRPADEEDDDRPRKRRPRDDDDEDDDDRPRKRRPRGDDDDD